jgi:hypothetical protein
MDRPLLSTTRWLQSCTSSSIQELLGTEIEILSNVLSLYSLLILDTCFLIHSLFGEIEKLVGIPIGTMSFDTTMVIYLQSIEGRRDPSVSKIHYTLYLGHYQKASA